MGTGFEKKAIGNGALDAKDFPDTITASARVADRAKKAKMAAEIPSETKKDSPLIPKSISVPSSAGDSQGNAGSADDGDPRIIDINPEFIIKQIQDVLKSPSPFTLYKKSTELKEDFASFINYLVRKIAVGFNSQDKHTIFSIYKDASYEVIWFNNLKTYLDEAKYFDVRTYFRAITTFDREKLTIARGLLKLYKQTSDDEVVKFLSKSGSKVALSQLKLYYKLLEMEDAEIEDPKYLDETRVEVFLEFIYFKSSDLGFLFQIFCFDLESMRGKFNDIYSIFSGVARTYLKNIGQKTRLIYEYLKSDDNAEALAKIDRLIIEFSKHKFTFYRSVAMIIATKNSIERAYFWSYVKTRMIDRYYPEVSRLFYWDKHACSNRNEWSMLKGNFIFNQDGEDAKTIGEILQFKKLILELNTNIFSAFLKPLVYSIVSEKLSITRKDLLKIRYIMTLVLSENFQEYKKMYNFFEDLEVFMDYNMEGFGFNFSKIKIFMADILVGLAGLIWLYLYSPVGVFVSCLILSGSYVRSHFFRFKPGIEWNIGIRPIATAILVISSFYWITNLDTTKIDVAKLTSKVEKIGVYRTDTAAKVAVRKINESGIKETVANILQSLRK